MMYMAEDNPLINGVEQFIARHGAVNCYIEITNNTNRRFREHNVLDNNGHYTDNRCDGLSGDAGTEQNARAIEESFLERFENIIAGGPGGGDPEDNPHFVYVYRVVAGITNEYA